MRKNIKHSVLLFLIGITLLFPFSNFSQSNSDRYIFKENKGQFAENVTFKSELQEGNFFLTQQGFTYSFFDKSQLKFGEQLNDDQVIHCHSVEALFKGGKITRIDKGQKSSAYENYYKGNDPDKWAHSVHSYNEILYRDIYPGIDYKVYSHLNNIKYDFILRPKANPELIKIEYRGQDDLRIKKGRLIIKTSLLTIIEHKPIAFQIINGEKVDVKCKFQLNENEVSFDFPEGYDSNYKLTIDPVIVFSSYVNSTSDNFGFAATYDTNENSFVSGIVFGSGYPTSVGAYDVTWAGGSTFPFYVDISISKFSSDGSSLLYSTYLGGADGEVPHSMVTNDQGELYVYGTTGSTNFPVLSSSYDNSFGGGTVVTPNSKSTSFSGGTDIFVVKFNSTGTTLLGATYIGGSGNDGINIVLGLAYNHGDEYRGDIVLDPLDNPYIISTTNSTNFPVVGGLTYRGGSSDAVVFKLNNNLSSLLWSTHFGGSGHDAGYGIVRGNNGNIFITGGTTSSSISMASNSHNGSVDGFLAKYNFSGTLLTSRYIGTSFYDQSYFVQTDANNDIFILGQSLGSMPVSLGVYRNVGTHQFVQKYNNSLSSMLFSTVIGSSTSTIDFSPTAFQISDCGMIYICGWGGVMNIRAGGSTSGLPVLLPYQGSSTGSDFYMMLLEKDAKSLFNATFFGGTNGAEHVDGGNSKFDKKGNIYQAVCAGCNLTNDYPTTIGVWSDTNGYKNNCNAALFKFKIDSIFSNPTVPTTVICFPNTVNFGNASIGGNTYNWNFGDGNFSSNKFPSHNYSASGRYTVTLIVSDSNGCLKPDTASIVIQLIPPPTVTTSADTTVCPNDPVQLYAYGATSFVWTPSATLNNATIFNPVATTPVTTTYTVIGTDICGTDTATVTVTVVSIPPVITTSPDDTICPNVSTQLNAYGATTYIWSPSTGLNNPSISNPIATPLVTTTYTVIGSNNCGNDTNTVTITVSNFSFSTSPDTTICLGDTVGLRAYGGVSYSWSPTANMLNSTSWNPLVFPPVGNIKYRVNITNADGCVGKDSVTVTVKGPPVPVLTNDLNSCPFRPVTLNASGATSYVWQPPYALSSTTGNSVISTTDTTITYYVDFYTACGTSRDSVTITVGNIVANSSPNDTVCFNDSTEIWATGGISYSWSPPIYVSDPSKDIVKVKADIPTTFRVIVTDAAGCTDTAYTTIYFFPKSFLNAGPDQVLVYGQATRLNASHSVGNFYWNSHYSLFCDTCTNSMVKPEIATDYIANLIDSFGCHITDTVKIFMDGSIYVPNTFTPNKDFKNETFVISGKDLIEFEITIFNRWGEVIYQSKDIDQHWDGNHKGKPCATDVYLWKIVYMDARLERTTKIGHVNLLR